jgi:predicted RNase H-like nuclease (RuvC/YqgF family)
MAGVDTRVERLEKKNVKLEALAKKQKAEIAALKKCCRDVERWIKLEVKWSSEVRRMLLDVDWTALRMSFKGGHRDSPPQTGPDYPPGN